MPTAHVLVFACGFVLGKSWSAVKGMLVPLVAPAARRFDEVYANAARKVTQRIEDIEDRVAERRYIAGKEMTN